MAVSILQCKSCRTYTLEGKCPKCSAETFSVRPPKYSPVDKYAPYRREAKKQGLISEGLL